MTKEIHYADAKLGQKFRFSNSPAGGEDNNPGGVHVREGTIVREYDGKRVWLNRRDNVIYCFYSNDTRNSQIVILNDDWSEPVLSFADLDVGDQFEYIDVSLMRVNGVREKTKGGWYKVGGYTFMAGDDVLVARIESDIVKPSDLKAGDRFEFLDECLAGDGHERVVIRVLTPSGLFAPQAVYYTSTFDKIAIQYINSAIHPTVRRLSA